MSAKILSQLCKHIIISLKAISYYKMSSVEIRFLGPYLDQNPRGGGGAVRFL